MKGKYNIFSEVKIISYEKHTAVIFVFANVTKLLRKPIISKRIGDRNSTVACEKNVELSF